MAKLELKIKSVFQSWGNYGGSLNFHPTDYKPTVSGVIGMIAAGMGIKRSEVEKLEYLKNSLSIKVEESDNYPDFYHDYQTVHPKGTKFTRYLNKNQLRAEDRIVLPAAKGGNSSTGATKVLSKDYIVNQEYTILIKGDKSTLKKVRYSLLHPYYPVYLGRKNCTPSHFEVSEILE